MVTHLRTGRGDDASLAQTIPQQLPGEGVILLRFEKGRVWFRRSSSCADCCRWVLWDAAAARRSPGFPDSPCYCISLTHRVRAGAASSTWLPWMAGPRVTVAPGAALRMSRSVWERPLPSWVQKGQMSLPVKS